MENLKTTEKLDKVTKLTSQAKFVKKQMYYGMEGFATIHKYVYEKIDKALKISDSIEDDSVRFVCLNNINEVMDVKINDTQR